MTWCRRRSSGAHRSGRVGPNRTTLGVRVAAATCETPVSFVTSRSRAEMTAASSPRSVMPARSIVGACHRAAHRRRERSLLIRSRQDDPRLALFRQPVAESGERLRRPAPAGVGCADVEPDHRAFIRRTDQRCRSSPFGRRHRKFEVPDQQAPRQPPPRAAASAAAPARSRPSSTPSSAAVRRADQSQRSAPPRVPRRSRCSPLPTHASGWRDRTVASAGPSAPASWRRLGDTWKPGERQEAIDRRQPRDEILPPRAGQ